MLLICPEEERPSMRYAHKLFLLLAILCSAIRTTAQPLPDCDEASQPVAWRAQLAADRAQIAAHHWRFTVGCSQVALRQVKDVTGYSLPEADYLNAMRDAQNGIAANILRLERDAIREFERLADSLGLAHLPEVKLKAKLPKVTAPAFDWTSFGKVSPVRDQQCTVEYPPGETC